MITPVCIALAASGTLLSGSPQSSRADTLRLEVGAREVDASYFAPHAARVRVRVGEGEGVQVAEWTNELTVGDSAGRRVHRWVTKGVQTPPNAPRVEWELRQTYDAVTLAPYGYHMRNSMGGETRLVLDGTRVRGTRRPSADAAVEQVDVTLDRAGYVAGASDLVPLAVGFAPGKVMTAPMWAPNMTRTELRVFTVIGLDTVNVEGTDWTAWKVEERRHSDARLLATWWLTEKSPYMVYGEAIQPNGQVRRMSEVEIPLSPR